MSSPDLLSATVLRIVNRGKMPGVVLSIVRALHTARFSIAGVALAYLLGVTIGLAMAHAGNSYALAFRDRIVREAQSSATLVSLKAERRGTAAALDCMGNTAAALGSTLSGYSVVAPYGIGLLRGWVGGVVSVDQQHRSRLRTQPFYYLVVLLLQIVPYAMAGGAGVNIGLAALGPYFGRRSPYEGALWLGIPRGAVADAARIYVLVVPLFALASSFEFFAA